MRLTHLHSPPADAPPPELQHRNKLSVYLQLYCFIPTEEKPDQRLLTSVSLNLQSALTPALLLCLGTTTGFTTAGTMSATSSTTANAWHVLPESTVSPPVVSMVSAWSSEIRRHAEANYYENYEHLVKTEKQETLLTIRMHAVSRIICNPHKHVDVLINRLSHSHNSLINEWKAESSGILRFKN